MLHLLDDDDIEALTEIIAWVKAFRPGRGGVNGPRGAALGGRRSALVSDSSFPELFFPAVITGHGAYSESGGIIYRWKYSWTEKLPIGDSFSPPENPRSGLATDDTYGLNLAEVNHTLTYQWGVDRTATNYPTGYRPRAVGGGGTADTHRYDVPVLMFPMTDALGALRHWFWAFGSHDGNCS